MKRKLLSLAVALLCSVGLFAETDVTATYLTNADFSNDGTGWTGTGSNKAQAFIIASNTTFEKGSDDKNAEMWIVQNQQLGSGDLNQTLSNVTAGIYRLSAKVKSDIKFYLYATAAGESEQHLYSETAIGVTEVSLIFVVKKTSDVTIGLKHSGVSINTYNWIAVDDFKLYYEGAIGSSVDVTSQIANWDFTGCENNDFPGWTISAPNGGNTWKNGDTRVEYWTGHAADGNFDYYQTITGLPTGKYSLSASMWNSTNSEAGASFGDGGTCGVYGTSSNGTQFKGVTTDSDNNALNTYTTDKIIVTDGNLRVGVKNNTTMTARWFGVDWIKLNYDPYISVIALDFSSGSEMAAGQWYKFTVDATGDYGFDVVDGVILTSNGSQALSEATGDALTQTVALSTGTTYYIKSTTAQTVTKSGKFTYTIGTATSDKSYIQEGNTVTISYASMTTTNTYTSEIDTEISGVTFGGNAISVSRTSKGFTFTVPTVTAGTDYTLSIPADVIGYQAPGSGKNEAQNITLKTPAVFDGTYYLYSSVFDRFLSRGSWWGTRAVADIYGTPVTLTTDANNLTTIKMVDNNGYIKDNYWLYTDGAIDKANHFKIQASTVEGYAGYQFLTNELGGTNYLYINSAASDEGSDSYGVAGNSIISPTEGYNITDWNQTVWQVMSISAHDTKVNAYPTANEQSVITSSGVSATAGELEDFLDDNYNAVDKSSLINAISYNNAKGDGWTWNATSRTKEGYPSYNPSPYASLWENTGYYTYSVDKANLPAGIYKLEMQGFDRRQGRNSEASLYASYGNIGASYLEANGQKVRIKNAEEMFEAHKSDDSGWTVNREWAGQLSSLDGGYAPNVVYVYLDGNTDLNIKIEKPDFTDDCCLVIGGIELTYYDQTEVTMTTSAAGKYGTFIAPFDVTIPSGVSAYTIESHDGARLNLTSVSTKISANTPVVVYNENAAISETFRGKDNSGGETSVKVGYLTGVYTASTVTAGNYVLQTQNGVQGFYKVYGDGLTAIPYRAYLTVPSGVKAFFFDVTDGITEVAEKTEATEVCFDLSGRRIQKPTKGLYIKNGKKVVIK